MISAFQNRKLIISHKDTHIHAHRCTQILFISCLLCAVIVHHHSNISCHWSKGEEGVGVVSTELSSTIIEGKKCNCENGMFLDMFGLLNIYIRIKKSALKRYH